MVKRTQTGFIARMIKGALPAASMPRFISPQLATLKSKAPTGDHWVHEIKFDGYRLQIHLNKGKVTVYTRNGHDWTNRFPSIVDALGIPVERAIFDGELLVVHDGRTNFSELQADLAAGKQGRTGFYAFDLLFLDGFDLRKSPQIERKRVLKMLFEETISKARFFIASTWKPTATRCSPRPAGSAGKGLYPRTLTHLIGQTATKPGSKSNACRRGNFQSSGSSRTRPVSPRYTSANGKAKTWFTWARSAPAGLARFPARSGSSSDTVVSPKSKLTKPIRKPRATWIEPLFTADVEFRDITSEGLLRQSSFKGLTKGTGRR
jgi:bifunctional non-homologous end joining protein LigD